MMQDIKVDYLLQCYRLAALNSPDPSTQNGALLVDFSQSQFGRVVASGVNEFPHGVCMTFERGLAQNKLTYTEHAERNVIYSAAREGIKTAGLTMFCSWSACAECARAIIQAGIVEVVTHILPGVPHSKWDTSIAAGMEMLHEAGVIVRRIDGKLDPTNRHKVRRNGIEVYP